MIEATGFADACPIATIALETASTSEPMRRAAAEAFESWLEVLSDRMRQAGIPRGRSRELAVELFCAIEGAFLLSRATQSARAASGRGPCCSGVSASGGDKALARGSTSRTS